MGSGVEFHPGVQYRHIMVAPADWADVDAPRRTTSPTSRSCWPTGPAAAKRPGAHGREPRRRRESGLAANQIWLWGQGFQPQMPSFAARTGCDAGLVTAVDLVRGLGVLTDIAVVEVPGATGWFDNDYEGKRDAALRALATGPTCSSIHVEATDEAGHAGDVDEKIKALEAWDRRILAGLVEGLDAMGPWRLLLLPDHATPRASCKTHTTDSGPYLLVDSAADGPGRHLHRARRRRRRRRPGHELMGRLVRRPADARSAGRSTGPDGWIGGCCRP